MDPWQIDNVYVESARLQVKAMRTSIAKLRDMALQERRDILAGIIPPNIHNQFSQALPGDANAIYHLIDQAGLEGMVSKRRDTKFRSGPSTNWLKTKCYTVGEFELLGHLRK
jgi:bifunctional non-homologous end joining protein LigD